jgi:hypothetical protein
MKNEKGYYNLDLTSFFVALILCGVIVGIALTAFVGWAWPYVKAFIHAITA